MFDAEEYEKKLEKEVDDCRTVLRHFAKILVETLDRYEPTRFGARKEGAKALKECLHTTGMCAGRYEFQGDNTGAKFCLDKGEKYHQTWLWIYDELAIWALQLTARAAAEEEAEEETVERKIS